MTQTLQVKTALTPEELKQVQDFAEFLVSRRISRPVTPSREGRANNIDVDALMGLCKGMGGDKSDKELIREAWDSVIDKLEK